MAGAVLRAGLWPVGTSVGAYPLPVPLPPGPPAVAPVTSSTAAADGSVTFTGLVGLTSYLAGAMVGGEWRSVLFMADAESVSSPAASSVVLDARAYGVVADGVTDDAGALQAALTAARAAASPYTGGATVVVPAGVVAMASGVQIGAGVALEGVGAPGATILRATGDGYFMVMAPQSLGGTRACAVRNLGMDAVAPMTSGGGFNGTANWGNVDLQDLVFGSNLYTCIQGKAEAGGVGGGRYLIDRIRVFNLAAAAPVTGITKAFVFDASASNGQAVEYFLSALDCSSAAGTDWLTLAWVDTVHVRDSLFYGGARGLVAIGADASHRVTSCRFSSVVFDTQSVYAVYADYVMPIDFTDCQAVTCTHATNAAVTVGANARGFQWTGGMISHNNATGVLVKSGSVGTGFNGVKIVDNNTSNQAGVYGVSVEAGTTDFRFVGCDTGNRWYGGHQKRGISVAAGASDRYTILGTVGAIDADQTVTVNDGGTGTHKLVSNVP